MTEFKNKGTHMRRRLAVLLLVSIFGAIGGLKLAADAAEPQTIKVVIDYGDGSQKSFTQIAWQEKLTVLQALEQVAKHPRGVKVATQGRGELAFVVAIDDLKNEGRGKNWLFRVNGKLADRSCGVFELRGQDEVEWRFSGEMP
jgi:basic membrane lipoprotein Med (substrate-binding protein (PBP1-ABC) superfamily)